MEFEANNLLTPYLYNDILSVTKQASFEPFENKTVLITGAATPLGYYLACAFLLSNDLSGTNTKVLAVDITDRIFEIYGKLTYRGDIDFAASSDFSYLGSEKADFVFHLEPVERYEATSKLLRFIEKHDSRALFAANADIYGDVFNGKDKLSEDDLFGYSDCGSYTNYTTHSKRTAFALAKKLDFDISFAVFAEIFGSVSENCSDIFDAAIQRRDIKVDKSVLSESAVYVSDAAAAALKIILDGKKGEVYNVSGNFTISPMKLAEKCSGLIFGDEMKVVCVGKDANLSPIKPNLKILDNTKLSLLGFSPAVKSEDAVVRTINIRTERKGGES